MTEKECLAAGIAVSLFAHFALLIAPRPPEPEPSFTTVVQMDMASPAVATSREKEPLCGREAAEAAADWLEGLGYLDDGQYARAVAEHCAAKGYGPGRIREELYRRGVPRDCWDGALEGLSGPEEAIDAFLQKKLRGAELSDPKVRRRAADALARRGYRWEDISAGLRRYGAEPEEW